MAWFDLVKTWYYGSSTAQVPDKQQVTRSNEKSVVAQSKPRIMRTRANSQVDDNDSGEDEPIAQRVQNRRQRRTPSEDGDTPPPVPPNPMRRQRQLLRQQKAAKNVAQTTRPESRHASRHTPGVEADKSITARARQQKQNSTPSQSSPRRTAAQKRNHSQPPTVTSGNPVTQAHSSPVCRKKTRSDQNATPSHQQTAQPNNDLVLIRIGNKTKTFRRQKWTHARVSEYARAKLLPSDYSSYMPTKTEMDKLCLAEHKLCAHNWIAMCMRDNPNMTLNVAKRKFRMVRKRKATDKQLKRIDEIVKNGPKRQILKATGNRLCHVVKGGLRMMIDEEQTDHDFTPNSFEFSFTETNVPAKSDLQQAPESLIRELKKFERTGDFSCECSGDVCDRKCPCVAKDVFFKDQHMHGFVYPDKNKKHSQEFRQHYSCSERCRCKGKCSFSAKITEPSHDDTEVMLHTSNPEKGFVVRAKKLIRKGESVVEMTGLITSFDKGKDDGCQYSLDIFSETNRSHARKAIQGIDFHFPDEYVEALQKATDFDFVLNPKEKSSAGRFLSNSCFGNTKMNFKHSQGVSPLRARVFFVAQQTILPNMEVTFKYSDEYIMQHLIDKCECGQLCCFRNRDLLPFVTMKNIQAYYKTLYKLAGDDFRRNVLRTTSRQ